MQVREELKVKDCNAGEEADIMTMRGTEAVHGKNKPQKTRNPLQSWFVSKSFA